MKLLITPGETKEVVHNAIKIGYRLIDGALLYNNEDQVGKAVRRAIHEVIVEHKDLFISIATEYVPVEDGKNVTLVNNKKEFIFERSPMYECWTEMEKLVDAGLVRNIGISNFNAQSTLDLLTYCKYEPATLEIGHHPYLQQKRLVDWVKSKNIVHLEPLFTHPAIEKISKKHSKAPSQDLLRWSAQRDAVVIPKSVNINRMKLNIDLFSFELAEQDIGEIEALDKHARYNDACPETLNIGVPVLD